MRSRAVTMGQIADILYRRGDLDEALRIRREEQLPVFDRLGDARERSVALHVLDQAETAFRKLSNAGAVEQMKEVRKMISGS